MYDIDWTKKAEKDYEIAKRAGFSPKIAEILNTVRDNPFKPTQGFEKLVGNLKDNYSRKISRHHRFVYDIQPNTEKLKGKDGKLFDGIVKIISMWGHNYK
jgi:Txe/YoeB family toxin of toxin-antitoxin system